MPTYTRHIDPPSVVLLVVGLVFGALCVYRFGAATLLIAPSVLCVVTGAKNLVKTSAR